MCNISVEYCGDSVCLSAVALSVCPDTQEETYNIIKLNCLLQYVVSKVYLWSAFHR